MHATLRALLLCALAGRAAEDPPAPPEDPVRARLAATMPERLARLRVPGVALAVVRDGRVAWVDGHGLADVERGLPVTTDTVFNAGSISKAVSAWAVMRLVERGELALDEPVEARLTRWKLAPSPHDASGVTARRLLSHTAGLSMHSIPGFERAGALPSLEAILSGDYRGSTYTEAGTPVVLDTAPGTLWRYSGGSFVLLQLLVEELTDEPFEESVQRDVLQPLGMTGSRFGWREELAARAAVPYDRNGRPHPTFRFTGTAGAGLYTTAGDLARFAAAGLAAADLEPGRRVLAPATVAAMFEPAELLDGTPVRCGLGYFLAPPDAALREAVHDGSNAGWRAVMVTLPDLGLGLVVLANSDRAGPLLPELVCAWAELEEIELSGCR